MTQPMPLNECTPGKGRLYSVGSLISVLFEQSKLRSIITEATIIATYRLSLNRWKQA